MQEIFLSNYLEGLKNLLQDFNPSTTANYVLSISCMQSNHVASQSFSFYIKFYSKPFINFINLCIISKAF